MAQSDVVAPGRVQQRPRERMSVINLVNLLLRDTYHRVTVLRMPGIDEPDPELFVVTRVDWRDPSRPLLPQLPRVLSLLEALRGTQSVPHEVYLDSNDGIAVYIPTSVRLSDIPAGARDAVRFLMATVEKSVVFVVSTMREVEQYFWTAARQKGFSPEIVERIGSRDPEFYRPSQVARFHSLMRSYFSIRFRIHTAESCIRLEA